MDKLPPPPPPHELARRLSADVVAVTRATPLFRLYAAAGPHPVGWDTLRAFGPLSTARFDHHVPLPAVQERAIVYLGLAIRTCVAEVYQDERTVDRRRRAPWLVGFRLRREVRLLDLSGTWPTRAGASQALNTGRRDRARAWARAAYDAYPDVEGLWYPSSMDGGQPAVALTERAADAVPRRPDLHVPLTHPGLEVPLARMARALGYALL